MEKIITGDIWKQAGKHISKETLTTACIAYVHTATLPLKKGDTLICDASEYAIKFAMTSAKILEAYRRGGVRIYSHKYLHAKLMYNKSIVVLGSANLSASSAENLREVAVISDSLTLCGQAERMVHKIKEEADMLTVSDLKKLLAIKVIRRAPKPVKTKRPAIAPAGDQCWFVTLTEFTEKKEEQVVEEIATEIKYVASENNVEEEDLGFCRYLSSQTISQNIKEGDFLVAKLNNPVRTRAWLCSPVIILRKKTKGKYTYFFFDSEKRKYLSWTQFMSKKNKLSLRTQLNKSKKIPMEDAENIRKFLKKKK